jgi:hypothetical protein
MITPNEEKEAYLKILDILEALPKKELIVNKYENKGCFCAVGAVMHHYGMDNLLADKTTLDDSETEVPADLAITVLTPVIEAYSTGQVMLSEIPMPVLEFLQAENDRFAGTKIDRYKRVISTLKRNIKELTWKN